jgi:hypothetical protein
MRQKRGFDTVRRYDELLTLSLTDTARLQRITQAQARGGASWRLTGSNLMSAMRCCGFSGTASLGKSSWRAVCCQRPKRTWQDCSGRCGRPCRSLL